jgi:hypothetical protein
MALDKAPHSPEHALSTQLEIYDSPELTCEQRQFALAQPIPFCALATHSCAHVGRSYDSPLFQLMMFVNGAVVCAETRVSAARATRLRRLICIVGVYGGVGVAKI